MTRSTRRKIVSPLFRSKTVEDPVQITEKGRKEVAHSDGSSSSVNMKNLRENLLTLKAYADYLPSDLPRAETEIYTSIMHQLKLVHGTPPYESAMKLVNEIFTNKKIKTHSVAASLVGCMATSLDSKMGGCDPRCLDSLPRDNSSGNSCEMQVFVYERGTLTHHGSNVSSSKAYVFSSEEISFSERHKEQLHQSNVDTIIVVMNESGVYHKKPPMAVNQIETTKAVEKTTYNSQWWWGGFILLILVILLIFIIGYMWYNSRKMKRSDQVQVVTSRSMREDLQQGSFQGTQGEGVTGQNWWAYSG